MLMAAIADDAGSVVEEEFGSQARKSYCSRTERACWHLSVDFQWLNAGQKIVLARWAEKS